MKTIVPSFKQLTGAFLAIALVGVSMNADAQSGQGGGSGSGNSGNGNGNQQSGLVFRSPKLDSGVALQKNAVYLFEDVFVNTDARLKIEDLVNGATVTKIDDNTRNLGYENALQPEVRTPGGLREAYAVFSLTFYQKGTNIPTTINKLSATALDIDGNTTLKEFCEMDMNGGIASFMSTTLDINILQVLLTKFKAINILGRERDGIDTSAKGNMYTVSNNNISSFKFKYGSTTIAGGATSRQFSLYMKGFNYPNLATLPVKLVSFNAILNTNKVDLKWVTAEEKNVSHFEIEKSLDGKTYNSVGIVFAFGNSTETRNYSFSDNTVNSSKAGVIYYRLRSVDIDKKSELSQVRLIKISQQDKGMSILTYPNPATSQLRITVPAAWQGKKVSYELVNNNGGSVLHTEEASASQTENLDISKLPVGFYLVKVSCNGEIAQQKIIKQ